MGRLRARGLGPRLLGGRGCSFGGWSSAPRTGCPMAAAPRRPGAAGATWSSLGSRPGGLSCCCFSFLDFSRAVFHRGCLGRGHGIRKPKPWASFREAGALRLGKGNFHQAWSSAPRSSEPSAPSSCYVSSAFSGQQLPSGLRCPLGELEGRGLKRDPVPGKAAPPLSFLASAPRLHTSLWR